MIEIRNLCKTFRRATVLNDVSLDVAPGRVCGLAGPNGSGKTMLMRAVAGLVRPTSGHVEIDGKRLWRDIAFPPSLGMLLEGPAFLDGQTGLGNLLTLAAIKGVADEAACRAALAEVGLDPDDKRKYRKYSLGMKQRLGLAAAVMERPDVLMLDEPTNALDAQGVEMAMGLVRRAAERGATVLMTCHDADVLRALASDVWYLAEGRVDRHEMLDGKGGAQ